MFATVPRPSEGHPRRRPRCRPRRVVPARAVLLGGLLLVLAMGCGVAFRLRPHSVGESAVPSARAVARASARPTTTTAAVRPFTAAVGDTTACQTLAAAEPQLLCPIPNGTVTYMQVTDLASRYRAVAGADDGVAERGVAACARGQQDERAWSRPAAPVEIAGRYRCRITSTRAEMWWTVDDAHVLAHATRADGDLAALFSWWRARAEHP
jgi:hypothetical protein